MGLVIGLLKRLLKLLIYCAIFVAVVLLIPNLPPYTKFSNIKIEQTQSRTGALSLNEALNNAQKLYNNKLIGPEAFRIYNGELYTGLATGEIVKISPGGHITHVTKIGQPCTGLIQENICGRPLGLEIDENNKMLYVADAYYGIWKVDMKTDKKQVLVSPNIEIEGKQPKIFNSLSLDTNGNLYWTHSSSDYDLKDGAMTPLSDPSGRLLYYNSKTNRSKVLLSNLWFANGIVISPDKQFVLVSESNSYRIMKYYINGPNIGKSEVFISGIPGVPDNLRILPDGSGVLATLYVVFDDKNPLISRALASTPLVRKFIARLHRLIEIPLEFLNEKISHVILEEIIYKIGHISGLSGLLPPMSGILQLDWNGNIVASYYNTDKSYDTASDAIVYNDRLYIGSPHSPYIASTAVPSLLKKAFSETKTASPAIKKDEIKKIPQPKDETAPKDKEVRRPEEHKITINEIKEIPKVHKTVEQPPKYSMEQKTPEQKSNIRSQAIDETKKPIEKDTLEVKVSKKKIKINPKPDEKKTIELEIENKRKSFDKKLKYEETKPITESIKKEDTSKTKSANQEAATKPITSNDIGGKKTIEPNTLKIDKDNAKMSTETPKVSILDSRQKQNQDIEKPVKAPVVKPAIIPNAESIKNKGGTISKIKKTNGRSQKLVPDQIPVKEDIPLDRAKPSRETLKVIKKSGPVEIPNPN